MFTDEYIRELNKRKVDRDNSKKKNIYKLFMVFFVSIIVIAIIVTLIVLNISIKGKDSWENKENSSAHECIVTKYKL